MEDEDIKNDTIVKIFDSIDYEYTTLDLIKELKKKGYDNPGEIILMAIEDDLLYVSSIEDDGTVYLSLTSEGEDTWSIYY